MRVATCRKKALMTFTTKRKIDYFFILLFSSQIAKLFNFSQIFKFMGVSDLASNGKVMDLGNYVGHLAELGFAPYDRDDCRTVFRKDDSRGRGLYVSVRTATEAGKNDLGSVEIMLGHKNMGHNENAEAVLAENLFWMVLRNVGYEAVKTRLPGKKQEDPGQGERPWLHRIARPKSLGSSMKLGRNSLDDIKNDVTFVAAVFENASNLAASSYSGMPASMRFTPQYY